MSHFIEKASLGQLKGRSPALPKMAISINPSNPRPTAGDTVTYYLTIGKKVAAASVDLDQFGGLVDTDFSVAFFAAVNNAVAVTPGVSLTGSTLRFTDIFSGVLTWTRTLVGTKEEDSVHGVTLSSPVGVQLPVSSASFVIKAETQMPQPVAGAVTPGVNLASGEFGGFASSLAAGSYAYPSNENIQNMYDVGIRVFRVPFRSYRVLTALYGPLDEEDFAKLDAVMAKVASLPGARLILDSHDYGAIRDPATGTAVKLDQPSRKGVLADMWIRISQRWAQYGDKFRIGLMNEPQSPATDANGNTWTAEQWRDAAVYEIGLMRAGGVTQHIYIPGAFWTGAHSWVNRGNAAAWDAVDFSTLGSFSFEMHQYLDVKTEADGSLTYYSGTSTDAVVGAGSSVLQAATTWARTKGVRIYLGEFGFTENDQMRIEARALIDFMNANADVWECWTAWSAGPLWKADYFMFVGQLGSGENVYQHNSMKLLMDYSLPSVDPKAPTGISLSSSATSVAAPQGNRVGKLALLGVSSDDYFTFADTFTLVDSANGRYQVVGSEIQVGATPLTVGEANTIKVRGRNRKGDMIEQSFIMPVVQAPTVALSRPSSQSVNEGASITIRVAITNPVANSGFDLWCGGGDPKQMVGDFENVVRPVYEAAGCTVQRINATKMRIRFGPSTVSGNVNVTWLTSADNVTEAGQYQWNVFLDNMVGVNRISGQSIFGYIQDTSMAPPWSIGMNPATVFEGGVLNTTLSITSPVIGAKVTLTPSGSATNSDFSKALNTAISDAVALETGLSFDIATGVMTITGQWDGSVSWARTVLDDADTGAETHVITLTDPVLSAIAINEASTTLRETAALSIASQDYENGITNLTTSTGREGISPYESEGGAVSMFAPNTLRIGSRGLLVGKSGNNLIKNPRGLGGAVGTTTLPTGWSITGGKNFVAMLVGRGEEDGHSYVDIRFTGEAGGGSSYTGALYLSAPTDNVAAPGEHTFTVGLKVVAGSIEGFGGGTDIQLRPYTATGAALSTTITSGNTSVGQWPLPFGAVNKIYHTAAGVAVAGTERLRPIILVNRAGTVGDPPVDMTLRIYSPTVTSGALGAVPFPVPANANGPVYFNQEVLSFNHTPAAEGVVYLEWTPVTRKEGEVVCCLYSDADNWVNLEYGDYGYLRLRSSVNGLVGVDVKGSFIVPNMRHKAAFRYAFGDWSLILDGEVVGTASSTALPKLINLAFGRNAAGTINSTLYLHKWEARNDQASNAVLNDKTKMAPFALNEGINLAGGEYGLSRDGDFRKWPQVTEIQRWIDKGYKRFRIPFRWENMQPEPFGSLWQPEVDQCLNVLNMLQARGAVALLDCHNYSNYLPKGAAKGSNIVLGTTLPLEAFSDFWSKLVTVLNKHPAIWGYDLMNEPKAETSLTIEAYKVAIPAIRAFDMDSWIVAEGKTSAAAMRYPGNSVDMRKLIGLDPANKLILGAHQYLDSNNAGAYDNPFPNGSDPETGYRRMLPYIMYLKAYGQTRGHIGEHGWPPNNAGWDRVGFNSLRTIRKYGFVHIDGWQGGSAVSAGDKNRLELINGVDPTSVVMWDRNLSK